MSDSSSSQSETVARLLEQIRAGNRSAFDELVPIVYEEFRELAHAQRLSWRGDDTLDTNALAHEAYLKLAEQEEPDWESHAHFRSVAARAMRQILIDYAKAKRAEKRGGERVRVTLDELTLALPGSDSANQQAELLVVLDESLNRLTKENERQSRIVECRFFGGMTVPDTAVALGVSRSTVKRGWAMAKAWLYQDMQRQLAR